MHDLPDMDAVRALFDQPLDPKLKTLLVDRLADIEHCGLQDYTHILLVQADDTEDAIVKAIGFSPLVTRIDGIRNSPDWDWIESHDGWWELLYTVGNAGFAFILLVEDSERSPLARLCRKQGDVR